MKKKLEIFGTFFIILFCVLMNLIFEKKEPIIIIILNINIFYLAYKLREEKKNIMIFYFVACNFIFNTSIALTNYLDNKYLLNSMFFTNNVPFNLEISKFIYDILIINCIGILLGEVIIKFLKGKDNKVLIKNENILLKILFFFFCISFGVILILNILEVKDRISIGYAISYTKEISKNISYYLLTLFNFLIIIYLALKPNISIKTKIIVILNIFLLFISSFGGSRGIFLIGFVFFIWYLEVSEIFKLKKRHMFILIFLVAVYSSYISDMREDYGKKSFQYEKINFKIIEIPKNFLKSQNGTSGMIGYIKIFPEIFINENNGKMMFYSFHSFYDSIFDKKKLLSNIFNEKLGKRVASVTRVSYIVNPELVKKGYGLGGNYILEMYEIGKEAGVLIFSILFVLLIYFLENIFKNNNSVYKNIFVLLVFQKIFYAPRSLYFDFNIRKYIYLCLIYFIMSKLFTISKLKKR